jgi:hypothetical protein
MNSEHRLALLAHIFDHQLKLAKKVVDETFRDPLKAFLMDQKADDRREGFKVGNLVKAYIQETRAKEELDAQKVQDDFVSGMANGTFPLAQIKELVAKGILGVTNYEEAARVLPGGVEGYTKKVAGCANPALKILTLDKGALEGVVSLLKQDADLEAEVLKVANLPLSQAIQSVATGGKVALQRP